MQATAGIPLKPTFPYYTGKLYTPGEVAKILRVAPVTVYRWITEGRFSDEAIVELPGKPGAKKHTRRIRGFALDELIFKRKVE